MIPTSYYSKNGGAGGNRPDAKLLLHYTSYTDIIAIGMTGYKNDAGELKQEIGVYYVSKSNFGIGQKVDDYTDFSFLKKNNFEAKAKGDEIMAEATAAKFKTNDYEVLSGNMVVAIWKNRQLLVRNPDFLPLHLKNYPDVEQWLATRSIDAHRAHSRLLKKALRMGACDDAATAFRVNGVTITDNYWVREIGSRKKYSDVCFDEAYFSRPVSKSAARLSLTGASSSFTFVAENPGAPVAELTNTGSFEKCWKNIDGKWWLFKEADQKEAFSEVFISKLCTLAGISCANYERQGHFVKTPDFTEGKFNFEPASAFMGEDEAYELTIQRLSTLCPSAVSDYIRMIFLDALVFNPDRHTSNFGLLRERETGKYIGLAPCFDHNMALISRGYPTGKWRADLLIRLFNEVMEAHPEYVSCLPVITAGMVQQALDMTNMRVQAERVREYILFRYSQIEHSAEN